jgi:hypothetical protein
MYMQYYVHAVLRTCSIVQGQHSRDKLERKFGEKERGRERGRERERERGEERERERERGEERERGREGERERASHTITYPEVVI